MGRNTMYFKTMIAVACTAAIGAVLAACATRGQTKVDTPAELAQLVERVSAGRSNFFMRSAFDTDPSPYLGRFVPHEGSFDVDDAMAMQTSCSQHISYRNVGGGGVQYDEYFNASKTAAAGLNAPLLDTLGINLGMTGAYSGGSIVRVRYTLTGKMIATIDDPDAFAECCEEGPGRCTGLYLGEFLEGTGEVMSYAGSARGFKAGASTKEATLGLDVRDGVKWQRSVKFDNPVYFAFKTSAIPPDLYQTFEECGSWISQVPRSNRGEYFVGLSEIVDSERIARTQAQRDARVQVVRYLGEAIQTGSIEVTSTGGPVGNLSSRLDQEDFIETAANGVATLVKDRCWCIEEHPTPSGVKYEAKVLAFLPQGQQQEAAAVIAGDGE